MPICISVNPVAQEYLPLFVEAGEEVGLDYPVIPDWESYRELMREGKYLFLGAEANGEPVGYIGILFSPCLFNRLIVHAFVDSFYVRPDYRGTA